MIEEFREINKKFHKGVIFNGSSLEFAVSAAQKTKNWQEQLAFILRAIINDQVFEDGNKRTAAAYSMAVFAGQRLYYDPYKVDIMVLSIAKNKKSNIKMMVMMIKNVLL